jgi:hypothetical protein
MRVGEKSSVSFAGFGFLLVGAIFLFFKVEQNFPDIVVRTALIV